MQNHEKLRIPRHIDIGGEPFVININRAALQNNEFRTIVWTGEHLQNVIMSVKDEIGTEVHPDNDQLIIIIDGSGVVHMGEIDTNMHLQARLTPGDAVFIPAGTWHNVVNTGSRPLKLTSIYAPSEK